MGSPSQERLLESTSMLTELRPMMVAVRKTLPSRAHTAMLEVDWTLTPASSPAPLEEPTCSNFTLQPMTTRRPCCPFARMERKLPQSSTRTTRTTRRTAESFFGGCCLIFQKLKASYDIWTDYQTMDRS